MAKTDSGNSFLKKARQLDTVLAPIQAAIVAITTKLTGKKEKK